MTCWKCSAHIAGSHFANISEADPVGNQNGKGSSRHAPRQLPWYNHYIYKKYKKLNKAILFVKIWNSFADRMTSISNIWWSAIFSIIIQDSLKVSCKTQFQNTLWNNLVNQNTNFRKQSFSYILLFGSCLLVHLFMVLQPYKLVTSSLLIEYSFTVLLCDLWLAYQACTTGALCGWDR